MKEPLKVGDRVRVFDSEFDHWGIITTITDRDPNTGRYRIEVRDRIYWVHSKQCRRLKPKKRREWFIPLTADGDVIAYNCTSVYTKIPQHLSECNWVRVREVRTRESCIERKEND